MHVVYKVLTFSFILFLIQFSANAQFSTNLNTILDSSTLNARKFHQVNKFENLEIFSGNIFNGYSKTIKGTPYYKGEKFIPWEKNGDIMLADITFRGIPYYGITAMYDAYLRTLIVYHSNGITQIILENEGIEKFQIMGDDFRHFRNGEIEGLEAGIYRYIVEGKYTSLALDSRILDEKITNVIEKEFLVKNYYFIVKDNKANLITNKRSLLNFLDLSASEFKAINKESNFKWKRNKEEIIKLTNKFKNSQ